MMSIAAVAPRRRMRPEDRAAQLLRVAEETFAEIGFHAATMEDIAHRAGVSRTVLYRHYDSKDALATACLAKSRHHLKKLMAPVASLPATVDPREVITQGARAAFTFIRTHAQLYGVFLAEGTFTSSSARTEAEGVRRDVEELAVGLLRNVAPQADHGRLTLFARAVVGASERIAQGLALESASAQEIDDAVDALVDIAWTALSALESEPRLASAPPH